MVHEYISYDQLPLILNAEDIARLLRISRSGAYALMDSEDFPTTSIGIRKTARKEKVLEWLDRHTANCE